MRLFLSAMLTLGIAALSGCSDSGSPAKTGGGATPDLKASGTGEKTGDGANPNAVAPPPPPPPPPP